MAANNSQHPPKDPRTSFAGKVVLVTGSNTGLGLEAAVKFAALGATRLLLGVRSVKKGEEAKKQICRRADYDPANVRVYELDMSSFASMKVFARQLSDHEHQLDAAVLNAGMTSASYQLSPEEYEVSVQVNVLSTALLAVLLLPKLREAARQSGTPSHLEFVGSVGHRMVKPDAFDSVLHNEGHLLDFVNDKKNFGIPATYCYTKLLIMYVMEGLVAATAERQSRDVIITTCCPNLCRTDIGREFSMLLKVPNYLFQSVFARTAEEGSRILVSGVTLGQDAHGQFWSHDVFDRYGCYPSSAISPSIVLTVL
jgi:NAD(P)-dependent dehydrogenase (short-subunit alcohol dehydrogenase family)